MIENYVLVRYPSPKNCPCRESTNGSKIYEQNSKITPSYPQIRVHLPAPWVHLLSQNRYIRVQMESCGNRVMQKITPIFYPQFIHNGKIGCKKWPQNTPKNTLCTETCTRANPHGYWARRHRVQKTQLFLSHNY